MSTKPGYTGDPADPFPEDELETYHSPEPWRQDGRYIRDASGAIVVRGRTSADARRIVAAVNATRDMPTEALESWLVQDVSDPRTRPDLEIALGEDPQPSPYAVRPPGAAPAAAPVTAPAAVPMDAAKGFDGAAALGFERRQLDRRAAERRAASSVLDPNTVVFDRRVMDRRFGERRGQ
ncbi:MAG: hypothetical protein WEB59_08415 [Thermoanaerobaculia bacterium]